MKLREQSRANEVDLRHSELPANSGSSWRNAKDAAAISERAGRDVANQAENGIPGEKP